MSKISFLPSYQKMSCISSFDAPSAIANADHQSSRLLVLQGLDVPTKGFGKPLLIMTDASYHKMAWSLSLDAPFAISDVNLQTNRTYVLQELDHPSKDFVRSYSSWQTPNIKRWFALRHLMPLSQLAMLIFKISVRLSYKNLISPQRIWYTLTHAPFATYNANLQRNRAYVLQGPDDLFEGLEGLDSSC